MPDLTPPPRALRVEHLTAAFGVSLAAPRLSWQLPAGAAEQRAFQVRGVTADREWSGPVTEDEGHLLVTYPGPRARARERTEWQVRVWTDLGESDWSEPGVWEAGLLDRSDWTARWVSHDEAEPAPPGSRPAYLLRGATMIDRDVARARIYATAHGLYELRVNGLPAGDLEYTPGLTVYGTTQQYQTYDVTELIAPGANVLGAVLSDGWYRGKTSFHRQADGFGDRTALLVQLHVDHTDGTATVFGTDSTWHSRVGPIAAADLYDGQEEDFRAAVTGWDLPGASGGGWAPVRLVDGGPGRLASSEAPPVRRLAELAPAAIERPTPDHCVVDFGQNVNGRVRLTNLGPEGTVTWLTHAEAREPETGDVTTTHVHTLDTPNQVRGAQGDRVTSSGRSGDVFEPRHTIHGFQYVRLQGRHDDIGADDVRAVVIGSDLPVTGTFECSDPRINRLHEIAAWTIRNQEFDVPIAEISRERAGWTGDWAFTFPSAALLNDVAGFTVRWLRSLAADQWPDGKVTNYTPDPLGRRSLEARFAIPHGQAGWGDAAVAVPWEVWRWYGDQEVLREQYQSMKAWVDYQARRAREHRHPDRVAARPEPLAHEDYLWDTGFHFGEHLEIGGEAAADLDLGTPDGPDAYIAAYVQAVEAKDRASFATAYFFRSASLLARTARLLGRDDEAQQYADLAERVRTAWQAEFVDAEDRLHPETQATYARAIAFGLIDEEARPAAATRLVDLIRAAGTHVGTGLPATDLLLPVLAETGHVDVAYELLLQDTPPSWRTVIERGGTTFWEEWEGIDADGGAHQALSLASRATFLRFLYQHIAGIRLDAEIPAYRRFRIEPLPGGGLTRARAHVDSPYGRIVSEWRLDDARLTLVVTVPPGTSADIVLPATEPFTRGPGTFTFTVGLGPPEDARE